MLTFYYTLKGSILQVQCYNVALFCAEHTSYVNLQTQECQETYIVQN